jgi:hypothetical protein
LDIVLMAAPTIKGLDQKPINAIITFTF